MPFLSWGSNATFFSEVWLEAWTSKIPAHCRAVLFVAADCYVNLPAYELRLRQYWAAHGLGTGYFGTPMNVNTSFGGSIQVASHAMGFVLGRGLVETLHEIMAECADHPGVQLFVRQAFFDEAHAFAKQSLLLGLCLWLTRGVALSPWELPADDVLHAGDFQTFIAAPLFQRHFSEWQCLLVGVGLEQTLLEALHRRILLSRRWFPRGLSCCLSASAQACSRHPFQAPGLLLPHPVIKPRPAPHSFPRRGGSRRSAPGAKGGLAYIKVPKTASTTMASVCLRIAVRKGMQFADRQVRLDHFTWMDDVMQDGPEAWELLSQTPAVWADHGERIMVDYMLDTLMPSATYLGSVRHPVTSCLSAYYFASFRLGIVPTTDQKVRRLRRCSKTFLLGYLRKSKSHGAKEVLASYDFLVVAERFDESLVILRRKLGVRLVDMLYLKAKESGKESTDRGYEGMIATPHPPLAQEAPEVQEAAMELWSRSEDIELVDLANVALDSEIRMMGFANFAQDLARLRQMLREVEEVCRPHYFDDCIEAERGTGCGQRCIDALAARRGWD